MFKPRLFIDWAIYRLLLTLAAPLIPLRLLWRGRRERGYWKHWNERMGGGTVTPSNAIWIHAVSVGEMRAAEPLISALRARHPGAAFLLTCMTPTGRATAQALYGGFATVRYLPYDYAWLVRRFLRRSQPCLGIFMETELWPNLVRAAHRIPLVLANARLSERSARGYARLPGLTRQSLQRISVIAAQSMDDSARLQAIGARNVHVTGSLKFDITPPAAMKALGTAWRNSWGASRRVWLAASTREGEEALILDAFGRCVDASVLLVLTPRHPQRFDAVAALLHSRGLKFVRRSQMQQVGADVRVILGDSLGEMFAYYTACDVAFVGGSLLPFGGQNPIEAMSVGCPVLIGTHTFNFEEIARRSVEAGAALRVQNADNLMAEAQRLLGDASARRRMGEAGRAFATRHRGAVARVMALISPLSDTDPLPPDPQH